MNHTFFIVTQKRPSDESPDYRQTETPFLVESQKNRQLLDLDSM